MMFPGFDRKSKKCSIYFFYGSLLFIYVCELTVSGIREGDNIRFEIRETGIGMRQDQIDEIWEEEPDQYRKQRIGRYAIKNIRERLLRKYQDGFTLEIQSEVGKGTTVILIVPYEEE